MYDQGLLRQGLDDVVPLGIFTAPPAVFFTATDISSLDDLKGLKSAASGPIRNQSMEVLGMLPVGGVSVSTMAESLSRGTIDVAQMNFTAMETFRVKDVATHAVAVESGSSMLFVLMNRGVYDSLSDADRAALDAGRAFIAERWATVIGSNEVRVRDEFRADPARTLLEFTDEERASLQQQLSVVTDAWIAATDGGQDMVDALQAEIARLQGSN